MFISSLVIIMEYIEQTRSKAKVKHSLRMKWYVHASLIAEVSSSVPSVVGKL